MIILIHSLKPKPKPLRVSNLFLWKKALKDKKDGIQFLKVNINLPLLFQILFIIMAALALINPIWIYESDIKGNVVIVIDSSASMNTRTANGTRFEVAKNKVSLLLNDISDVNKVMVIEASHKPVLLQNFTSDLTNIKTMVSDLQPTEIPGNLMASVYFGLSLMNYERGDQMIVYTDAAGQNTEELLSLNSAIKLEIIKGGDSNIGITKFNFRPDIELNEQYEMILEVQNFNKRPAICPVNVFLNAQNIYSKTIGLKAREKKLLIFPFQGTEGIIEASLAINDDFHVDNKAFAVIEKSKKIKVLLVGLENYFLQRLLETKANIKLEIVSTIDPAFLKARQKDFDIIILDRTISPEIKSGNIISIQSPIANLPFHLDQIETTPMIQDWDREHPILKHVNLSSLKIAEFYQIRDNEDLIPIVTSDQSGLIFAYQTPKLKVIFFSFDLLKSDLPLKVGFPIMVDNIIKWLSPRSISRENLIFQTGEPIPINLMTSAAQFLIRDAEETLHTIRSEKTKYLFNGTKKVGIYHIIDGNQETRFAVNLSDAVESNIHSTDTFIEKDENGKGTDPFEVEFYFWILLVLISVIFLILEWYFWYKKLTV